MELTAQKGKGDKGKKISDCARTWDLRSIAECQPREPRRPIEILCPPLLLGTGHSDGGHLTHILVPLAFTYIYALEETWNGGCTYTGT